MANEYCRLDDREGGRVPFALPGARTNYAPDRLYDVRHIRIELRLDFERRRISGTCALTVAPIREGLREWVLDAVELDIGSVHVAGGPQLPFRAEGGKLFITLDPPRPTGEEFVIEIDYQAHPRRGLYFIAPDEKYPDRPLQAWTQGQDTDSRYWFPCFDAPNEKSPSEVLATVPEEMEALSNGHLVEVKHDRAAKTRTYHWRQDVPHSAYLICLAAGKFEVLHDRWESIDVNAYFPPGRAEDARRSFGRTSQMMQFFSEYTRVKYAWDKYAQVAVAEFIFGGMENTSCTILTDQTLHDARAHADFSSEPLVAHELAHQWFGDLLTCREWAHGWLNEGFATYFEALWKEKSEGADEFEYEMLGYADDYFDEDSERYRRPIVCREYADPVELFDRHLYQKGSLVLHMLRDVLGEAGFRDAISWYLGAHRNGNVTTEDLARAVEDATGRNVDGFFDQWVHQGGHPSLEAEYAWDADRGAARVRIKGASGWRLPIEVALDGRSFHIEVQGDERTFHFPLETPPKTVRLDPHNRWLKTVKWQKPAEMWRHELRQAPEAVWRALAARELGKSADARAVADLRAALVEDPFWGVRAEAAKALGKIRGPAALEALEAGLGVEHPKARKAVASALGEFRGDEHASDLLLKLLADDASYFVEAEAARALGKTRTRRALDALLAALPRESFQQVLRARALEGLGELRDVRALPAVLERSRYGEAMQARVAAAKALGLLGEGNREVREHVERMLIEDPEFRVRREAADALWKLGDASGLGALDRAAAADIDGRVRRAARETALRLRDGKRPPEALRELRKDVDALRAENDRLRTRLDRIEGAK